MNRLWNDQFIEADRPELNLCSTSKKKRNRKKKKLEKKANTNLGINLNLNFKPKTLKLTDEKGLSMSDKKKMTKDQANIEFDTPKGDSPKSAVLQATPPEK